MHSLQFAGTLGLIAAIITTIIILSTNPITIHTNTNIKQRFINDKNKSQQQAIKANPFSTANSLSTAYGRKKYFVNAAVVQSQSYKQSQPRSVFNEPCNQPQEAITNELLSETFEFEFEAYIKYPSNSTALSCDCKPYKPNTPSTALKYYENNNKSKYKNDALLYAAKAINISWAFTDIFYGIYSPTTSEQTPQVNENNNINNKSVATLSGTDGIRIGGSVAVAVTSTHTSPGLLAATFSSTTATHTSQLNIILDGTCTGCHRYGHR